MADQTARAPKTSIQSYTFNDDKRAFKIRVPVGMSFVTVLNPNAKQVGLFYGEVTADVDFRDSLIPVIPFQNQTLPLERGDIFTLVGAVGGGDNQQVKVLFADQNLQINNPTAQPGGQTSVNIASDSAGLARANQFPNALQDGGVKTAVVNTVDVNLLNTVTLDNDASNPVHVQGQFTASPDISVNFDTFDYNVTTAGTQLPGNICKEVVLVADESGTSPLLIGKSASSCTFPIQPGQTIGLPLDNTNRIFVRSASATVVHVLWRV